MSSTPVTISPAPIEPAMRFSASRMKLWMNCPAQAHFKYDLKLPGGYNAKTVFGTVIHHCLELYNTTGNLDLCVDTFKKYWQNPAPLGYPDHGRWPKMTDFGGLRKRGIEILQVFDQNCVWSQRTVIAAEHRFCVPFGKHELTGAVDLVETRKSGKGATLLRIVDYKTASRQPNRAELALDIQFTIYIYASLQKEFWVGNGPDFPGIPNGEWLWETHKDMPRRAIWFHLWGQKEIDAGPRDDEDFGRLYRLAKMISKTDAAEIHIPRIGDACTFCDFTDKCGIHIPSAEELREDPDAWI